MIHRQVYYHYTLQLSMNFTFGKLVQNLAFPLQSPSDSIQSIQSKTSHQPHVTLNIYLLHMCTMKNLFTSQFLYHL